MNFFTVSNLPEVYSCKTREEVLNQCDAGLNAILALLKEVPDEYLKARAYPEGWTVARNIGHISKSNVLFSIWIRLPSWFVRLFGQPRKPAIRIEDTKPSNRPAQWDYGSYKEPGPVSPGLREKLEAELTHSFEVLKKSIAGHSDTELDNLSFGKMSLKVYALFCLKHALFHAGVFKIRLKESRVLK